MATYHENAGKGDHRRKEDTKAFEKNFDGIDWSVKVKPVEEKKEFCQCCGGEGGMMNAGMWVNCLACKE